MADRNENENPLEALAAEDLMTYPEGYNKLQEALGDAGPALMPALFSMLILL